MLDGMLTRSLRGSSAVSTIAAFALLASGCGGSDSGSSGSGGAGSTSSSSDAARVKFAQCMRENGVDVPDNPGQAGAALQDIDQDKLQAAMEACRKYQQDAVGDLSEGQQQEFRDQMTKFASCMRKQGVDIPDIGSGGGPPSGDAQLDPSDPKVQAAQEACQSSLPQGFGAGGQ